MEIVGKGLERAGKSSVDGEARQWYWHDATVLDGGDGSELGITLQLGQGASARLQRDPGSDIEANGIGQIEWLIDRYDVGAARSRHRKACGSSRAVRGKASPFKQHANRLLRR